MVCGGNWDTWSALPLVGFGKSLVIGGGAMDCFIDENGRFL
jgi:hypothetical protein